jgi:hypothetical protein
VLQPTHISTFLFDPLYAVEKDSMFVLPPVTDEHATRSKEMVKRVGGEASAAQIPAPVVDMARSRREQAIV